MIWFYWSKNFLLYQKCNAFTKSTNIITYFTLKYFQYFNKIFNGFNENKSKYSTFWATHFSAEENKFWKRLEGRSKRSRTEWRNPIRQADTARFRRKTGQTNFTTVRCYSAPRCIGHDVREFVPQTTVTKGRRLDETRKTPVALDVLWQDGRWHT